MGEKLIILFIILCSFILGSFNSTVIISAFPIDIEEKDKKLFAQAKLFLDTNMIYAGENLWCSKVIHEGKKITFVFRSGEQKEIEENRVFGLYNKIDNCACLPIRISFINDSMIVE